MRFSDVHVDRYAGRLSGQFDLAEDDLAKVQQGDLTVLVVIARPDELAFRPNQRTGETTLLQVWRPLDVHVAINGLREQLLTAINDDDQLKLEFTGTHAEPSEADFEPPDDVETFPAATREAPREGAPALKPMLPLAEEIDEMGEGTRVIGHVDDRPAKAGADSESPTARGRRALRNFMEAPSGH